MLDGRKYDIEVTNDGTLLSKVLDEEQESDDDGEAEGGAQHGCPGP